VLADYLIEIVAPAFTNDTFVRRYGKTSFHFYEVEIVTLDEHAKPPVKGIVGRFIKDTELTRHQIFDPKKGLVQDERHMRSSPSASFVLILNSHRLIYFPETPHAPSLNEFKGTAESFLRQSHKKYIDELYKKAELEGKRVTKKVLYEMHERPTVEVVPLTATQGVRDFMQRYEVLKNVNFRLIKPNSDIDAGEIFSQFRELANELNGNRALVTVSNSKEGLDIDAAIDAVAEATAGGNQDVTLSGVDHSGNKLQGSNEHFQISVPIDDVPATKRGLINKLYGAFRSLTNSGDIVVPPLTDGEVEKIRRAIGMV